MDVTFAWEAATEAVRILPGDWVIGFISQFPVGSESWKYAMYGTDVHKKEVVIDYVKTVMKQSNVPSVRRVCYGVCQERGWADLSVTAVADLTDRRGIGIRSGATTLGKVAQEYLDSLPKPRP